MLNAVESRSLGTTEMGVSTSAWNGNGEEWEAEIREGFPER